MPIVRHHLVEWTSHDGKIDMILLASKTVISCSAYLLSFTYKMTSRPYLSTFCICLFVITITFSVA